jgi:hypothetical protein
MDGKVAFSARKPWTVAKQPAARASRELGLLAGLLGRAACGLAVGEARNASQVTRWSL